MKFIVHTYQVIRVSYEVEAETNQDACKLVNRNYKNMTPCFVGSLDEDGVCTGDFVVDPILPSGEVDYDNISYRREE